MILENKHFSLYPKTYTSSASRNLYYFYNPWNAAYKYKNLTTYLRNKAGRNCNGRIVIWTRASRLQKNRSYKINYNLRYLRFGTVASFAFLPFSNKILTLIFFNNGAATYYLSTDAHILFAFFSRNLPRKLKKVRLKPLTFVLFQIKKLSYISCLELLPGKGSQYVRSPGTKSRLIKLDNENHTALVQLPSTTKKIFSYYSFALPNPITLSAHKKCLNFKAGHGRVYGRKPIVRGVAMNAVDHPHGGRTKSVKYQRTPWGKTTKFK